MKCLLQKREWSNKILEEVEGGSSNMSSEREDFSELARK
jgi:hypothetical protein